MLFIGNIKISFDSEINIIDLFIFHIVLFGLDIDSISFVMDLSIEVY